MATTFFGDHDQIWVLSVYALEQDEADGKKINHIGDQAKADEVNQYLHNAGLVSRSITNEIGKFARIAGRRRLSPGETFLHRLRQAKPYRDSPVLTRLVEEIREANRQ